jgi:hypothetical protein
MKCFVHAMDEAVGTCVRCGKGVCNNCSIVVRDQLLCRECAETLLVDRSATKFETEIRLKDPASAAAMSLLHAGLGQLYNGDIKKGLALFAGNFVLEVVNAVLGVVAVHGVVLLWGLVFITLVFVWFPIYAYSIWDAYRSASDYNKQVAPKRGGVQVDGWSEYHGSKI